MVARRQAKRPDPDVPEVIELSPEESRAWIEAEVQQVFGMSADEFLRRWHAGSVQIEDRSEQIGVLMMLGLAG